MMLDEFRRVSLHRGVLTFDQVFIHHWALYDMSIRNFTILADQRHRRMQVLTKRNLLIYDGSYLLGYFLLNSQQVCKFHLNFLERQLRKIFGGQVSMVLCLLGYYVCCLLCVYCWDLVLGDCQSSEWGSSILIIKFYLLYLYCSL